MILFSIYRVIAMCIALVTGPCVARTDVEGSTYIGVYSLGRFTTLVGDMPFDDSPDAPGPGKPLQRPYAELIPVGRWEGGRFHGVGHPDDRDTPGVYGSALRACYAGASHARVACSIKVAAAASGFNDAGLARTTWFCDGKPLQIMGASAAFNDTDRAEYPASGLAYAVAASACGTTIASSASQRAVVTTDPAARTVAFRELDAKARGKAENALDEELWAISRPAWQNRIGRLVADAKQQRPCYDSVLPDPVSLDRVKKSLTVNASWRDYVAAGGTLRALEAKPSDGAPLLLVDLMTIVAGENNKACRWKAHVQVWLTEEAGAYKVVSSPVTDVVVPISLVTAKGRHYVFSVASPSNIVPHATDDLRLPDMAIDRWDGSAMERIGYPGVDTRVAKPFPLGSARP
ncbi:MAG: hypothetical protein GAK28_04231 [Luteibacter sp.]|uniref:hypothetical protein n=1 Tax=Luteibacter sp. TaxID=1886636 RepID=UPI001380D3CF|nr:hypothetical protein [Luteibacter sp.]KAF1004067.1 MAG: hypothetical protein GAK28_04231 [Luteibacter sp.]